MRWRLGSVLALVINTLQNIVTGLEFCQCANQTLCKPITSSHVQVELFTFHLNKNDWAQYHWSKITTIVVTDEMEDELYCIAHSHNIRLALRAEIELAHLTDKTLRGFWMEFTVELVRAYNVDGINMDFVEKLKKGSQSYHQFTRIMIEVTSYFRNEIPGCQISFNVPWSPNCKNEKCFDFLAISYALDLFFVESFNIRNDMREGCVATSSSPYYHVLRGIADYIKLGVDSRKLVMGVPWYGHDYTCKRFFEDGMCELENTSQKDRCSYPVARRIPYKEIVQRLLRSLTGRLWNDDQKVPYFFYLDGKTYHQVLYDDPESISMKSTFLKRLKLGGIGVMNLSDVDPSRTSRATLQAAEMWNALCPP